MIIQLKHYRRLLVISLVILIPFIALNILNYGVNHKSREASVQPDSLEMAVDKKVQENISKNQMESKNFFAEYRLKRDRVRGRQVEILREIAHDSASTVESRSTAEMKLIVISDRAEKELQAETMIRSLGYKECAVMIKDASVNAIIEVRNLSIEDEEAIKQILVSLTGEKKDSISVIAREKTQ